MITAKEARKLHEESTTVESTKSRQFNYVLLLIEIAARLPMKKLIM